MTDSRILEILQHSMGLDRFGRGTRYRNHFVTGAGSTDHPVCMAAVDRGLMKIRHGNAVVDYMDVFHVTPEGLAFIEKNSPKVTAKQRARDRYAKFLDLKDCWPDLTFLQFLRLIKAGEVEA